MQVFALVIATASLLHTIAWGQGLQASAQPSSRRSEAPLIAAKGTVLAAQDSTGETGVAPDYLIQVDEVLEGYLSGSVILVRVGSDLTSTSSLEAGNQSLFFLKELQDGSYQLEAATALQKSSFESRSFSSVRGYRSRACGFDLDGDGVLGESGDDCNICDGSTTDPDGDGIDEDLFYVDCGAGSNGNGTAGNPFNRLSSAIAAMDGPGDGAEDIVCFRGTCRNESLVWGTQWCGGLVSEQAHAYRGSHFQSAAGSFDAGGLGCRQRWPVPAL